MATLARVNGGARNIGTDAGNLSVTGRTLTHYTITSPGLYTFGNGTNINYLAAGSDYEKLVLAIEQVGSIELLGQPASGNLFHVAITGAAPSPSTGTGNLQGIVNAAVSGATAAAFTY
jgi:hypothetical protein